MLTSSLCEHIAQVTYHVIEQRDVVSEKDLQSICDVTQKAYVRNFLIKFCSSLLTIKFGFWWYLLDLKWSHIFCGVIPILYKGNTRKFVPEVGVPSIFEKLWGWFLESTHKFIQEKVWYVDCRTY